MLRYEVVNQPEMTGKCPASPALEAGSRGTNKNEISFPGSPALWAGSFTSTPKRFNSGSIQRPKHLISLVGE